ncbi:MAG: lipocalin family protein [Candidatus Cloacimonetes bacterium]|nr:lipocalin family protein [Candidatus Cloacimonadota bacterium]
MRILLLILLITFLTSCKVDNRWQTVPFVNLEKFMGDWYVISILPNSIEKKAVNSIESYKLNEKGNIDITYSFFIDEPTGKKKVMHPKAEVYDLETNSEWRVQFIWPLKFAYLIIWLDEDYETTVIGVPNQKYVWIMSRKPEIAAAKYEMILQHLRHLGYDVDKLMKIPQIWE